MHQILFKIKKKLSSLTIFRIYYITNQIQETTSNKQLLHARDIDNPLDYW